MKFTTTLFGFALFSLIATIPAISSEMVVLNAVDSGWYHITDGHPDPSNQNYYAYIDHEGIEYRNFFVFDLTGLSQVLDAQLRVYSGSFHSNNNSDPYEMYDVTTSISDLRNNTGDTAATFQDLGSGDFYGGYEFSWATAETVVDIQLTAEAITDINSSSGLFALGGKMATIITDPNVSHTFGLTDEEDTRQLILKVVPEPSSLLLASIAGCALLFRKRRI